MAAKPNTVLIVCGTVIICALIISATFLTQTNHGADVRSAALVLTQAVLGVVNLLGISLHGRAITREQTTELERAIPAAVANGNGANPGGGGDTPDAGPPAFRPPGAGTR